MHIYKNVSWVHVKHASWLEISDLAANVLNYRHIALTSSLCKTIERKTTRSSRPFEKLRSIQAGVKLGRFAANHLIWLETEIRNAFVNNEHIIWLFFDLEKAYDTSLFCGIHCVPELYANLYFLDNFGSFQQQLVRFAATLLHAQIWSFKPICAIVNKRWPFCVLLPKSRCTRAIYEAIQQIGWTPVTVLYAVQCICRLFKQHCSDCRVDALKLIEHVGLNWWQIFGVPMRIIWQVV